MSIAQIGTPSRVDRESWQDGHDNAQHPDQDDQAGHPRGGALRQKPLNSVGGRRLRRGQAVGLVMDVGVAFEGGRVLAAVVGVSNSPPPWRRARTKAWAPHRSHRSAADRLGASAAFTSASSRFCTRPPGTGVPSDQQSNTRNFPTENSSRVHHLSVTVCRGPARGIPSGPRGVAGLSGPAVSLLGYHPPHPRSIARGHRREEDRDHEVHSGTHRSPPAGPRGPGGGPQAPGMYIGSTDSRGPCTASGRSSTTLSTRPSVATVTGSRSSLEDGSVEVRDNGRGVPVDIGPRPG